MNKFIKEEIKKLKPSATLAINEESNRLKKMEKKFISLVLASHHFQFPKM